MKLLFVFLLTLTCSVWVQAQNSDGFVVDSSKYSKKLNSNLPVQDSSKSIQSILNRNKNRLAKGYTSIKDTSNRPKIHTRDSLRQDYNLVDTGKIKISRGKLVTTKDSLLQYGGKTIRKSANEAFDNSKQKASDIVGVPLDSSFKKSLTDSMNSGLNRAGSVIKHNAKDFKARTFQSLKNPLDSSFNIKCKFKSSIQTKGSITFENYITNYLLPIQPGERAYSRVHGNTTLTLLSLPFIADFYLTTEKNTFYNANSFSLSFDVDQFKQNLTTNAKNKVKDQTSSLNEIQRELMGQEYDLSKLNSQMDVQNLKLAGVQQQLDGLESPSIENTIISDYTGTDKLKSQAEGMIQDSVNKQKQVLSASSQKNKDSLLNESAKIKQDIDALNEKIDYANKTIGLLKNSDSLAQTEIAELKNGLNSNSIYTLLGKNSGKVKGLDKVLSSISSLNIGLFNPVYTRNSVNGITVKGVNATWDSRLFFGNLTLGNTYRDQLPFRGFGTERPKFDRRIAATMLGFGKRDATNIYGLLLAVKDKPTSQSETINSQNTVLGFGGQIKVAKILQFNGEILSSRYEKNAPSYYNSETSVMNGDTQNYTPRVKQLSRMAFNFGTSIFPVKTVEIKSNWKWVGPGYRSLAAPYTRTNYDEKELAIKWKLFKNRLNLSGFYKTNKSDPLNFQEGSYTMSGYGFNMKTNFKKLPNVFMSYSPFEQGNNSPDTVFRSNNKFSLLTGGINYRFANKKYTLLTNAIFSRSHTEFIQLENRIGNQFNASFSQNLQYKKSFMLTGTYSLSKTSPSVDSLNNYRFGLISTIKIKTDLSLGLQLDASNYNNGGNIRSGGIQLIYKAKKRINLSLRTKVNRFEGIYGLSKLIVYEGILGIEYRW
jgi:hypothetical protein